MVTISENLRNAGFIVCRKEAKEPEAKKGEDWNELIINYEQANLKLQEGYNIGVVAGLNDFFLIDCDSIELSQACEGLLPKTYSEQTCSGGFHYFYKIKGQFDNKKVEMGNKHLGEIRTNRQYVVIAPSRAKNKRGVVADYKVLSEVDNIPYVSVEQVRALLSNFGVATKDKPILTDDAVKLMEKYQLNLTDTWLYDLVKNQVLVKQETGGNSIVLKNSAIILARENIPEEELRIIGKAITDLTEERTLPMLFGWIKKAKNGELAQVNEAEIDKFIENGAYSLTKYKDLIRQKAELSNRDYRIFSFSDFKNYKQSEEYVVKDFLKPCSLNMFVAPPSSFKTITLTGLAVSIATGKDWLAMPVKQMPVLLLQGEDSNERIKKTLTGFYNSLELTDENFPLYVLKEGTLIDMKKKIDLGFSIFLERTIEEKGIKVLIFDTLHRFCFYDENKSDDINLLYSQVFKPLMEKYNLAICFLHHTTKGANPTYRGTGDFLGMVDCSYRVEANNKTKKFKFINEKNRDGEIPEIHGQVIFEGDYITLERINEVQEAKVEKSKFLIVCDKIQVYLSQSPNGLKYKDIKTFLESDNVEHSTATLSRALKWLYETKNVIGKRETGEYYLEVLK